VSPVSEDADNSPCTQWRTESTYFVLTPHPASPVRPDGTLLGEGVKMRLSLALPSISFRNCMTIVPLELGHFGRARRRSARIRKEHFDLVELRYLPRTVAVLSAVFSTLRSPSAVRSRSPKPPETRGTDPDAAPKPA